MYKIVSYTSYLVTLLKVGDICVDSQQGTIYEPRNNAFAATAFLSTRDRSQINLVTDELLLRHRLHSIQGEEARGAVFPLPSVNYLSLRCRWWTTLPSHRSPSVLPPSLISCPVASRCAIVYTCYARRYWIRSVAQAWEPRV